MLLGGKGANLCEMAKLKLPVPPAFVITTETCLEYFKEGTGDLPKALDYEAHLEALENDTGKKFGDMGGNALLVSVRSGAPASMPGAWGVRACARTPTGAVRRRAVKILERARMFFFDPNQTSILSPVSK